MKKNITATLMLLLLTVSSAVWATPRDHDYYWVIETATHSETYTVFRIYQHENQLVYEEKILGKKLDIHKKKVRRQLEKVLDLYVNSMEQISKVDSGTLLRSMAFR